jgi:hypothetical protein
MTSSRTGGCSSDTEYLISREPATLPEARSRIFQAADIAPIAGLAEALLATVGAYLDAHPFTDYCGRPFLVSPAGPAIRSFGFGASRRPR